MGVVAGGRKWHGSGVGGWREISTPKEDYPNGHQYHSSAFGPKLKAHNSWSNQATRTIYICIIRAPPALQVYFYWPLKILTILQITDHKERKNAFWALYIKAHNSDPNWPTATIHTCRLRPLYVPRVCFLWFIHILYSWPDIHHKWTLPIWPVSITH